MLAIWYTFCCSGETAYVLTQERLSYRLWNPITGENYEIENAHCPLRSVGTIIACDNIYGNIQTEVHPSKISYALTNPSCWRPFFGKSYRNPGLASIQNEEMNYAPSDKQHAIEVRQ